jgi:primosomal protein N' (replication factor Y)
VLPDVPAIDKTFDYLVPDALGDRVRVGTMVRISLAGRRVGGWVVELDVVPPPGVKLQPIAKVTGWGPPAELIDLARWAAWRWAGRAASFLRTASPERVVGGLPAPAGRRAPIPAVEDPVITAALRGERAVLRLPPAADVLPVVQAAASLGNALVILPTVGAARALAVRLRRAGVPVALHPRDWALGAAGATVIGTRAAAWAPVASLAAVVVVDEHDEGLQQEQSPTWHARDVAIERARRAGVPCVLTSPCPTLEAQRWCQPVTLSRTEERAGWPPVEVVDRRREDPRRAGLFSPALVRLLGEGERVLCVLNRTGRAKLLACTSCGELARCERCDAAVEQPADDFVCPRCGANRPSVCLADGGTRFANRRMGVSRAREELEALVGEPVVEVAASADSTSLASARVYVGTEAVLHQVGGPAAVAFLDLDQELLAPRYRAAEEALTLLARAARVATAGGARHRLLLQTRLPKHEVVQAAVHADPSRVSVVEAERRALLRYPPEVAMAVVSGPAAAAYVDALGTPLGVQVLGPSDGRWLISAAGHQILCDALAQVARPPGRLRLEVDPLRL